MKAGAREIWDDLVATAERHAERQHCPALEIWLLEPGLHALARHRLAHALWEAGWLKCARLLAGWTRRATGFDLHPGARVGARCLLLQGGGVVVGETAVIGDDALIEPGVMLLSGGMAVPALDPALAGLPVGSGARRVHPTVGKRAVLEAGALLVGDVYLGDDVRVLAGAVVTRDVPDRGVVVGSPGRVLAKAQVRPDPDARAVQAIAERLYKLEEQVQVVTFAAQRQVGAQDPWRATRNPDVYGPIQAVEDLIDGAGI